MRYIVDRVEGGIAVCETEEEKTVNIPLRAIAGDVRGGEVIERCGSGYVILPEETDRRRERIIQLQRRLWSGRSE